jgi:hypothetical protein
MWLRGAGEGNSENPSTSFIAYSSLGVCVGGIFAVRTPQPNHEFPFSRLI